MERLFRWKDQKASVTGRYVSASLNSGAVLKKKKTRRKASSRTKEIKQADLLWARLIKTRDEGKCQYPGCPRPGVHAHHLYSRRHLGTRWNLENGILLCAGCHFFIAHKEYELFRCFIIKLIGEDKFNQLKALAYLPTKVDVSLVLMGLKQLV